MVRPYTIRILIAALILLLSGGLFMLFQTYFVSNVAEIPHVEHDESLVSEVIEVSHEEFINMNARTPEEVAELREMYGI